MIVLLIDDDNDDVELFTEAIHQLSPDITCWSAKDGAHALQMLNGELVVLPDYIFLDVNMPIMGGQECLSEIKSNPRLRNIPVFMYSTTSNDREIEKMKAIGAKDFVVKPPNFNHLVALLKSVLLKGHTVKSA